MASGQGSEWGEQGWGQSKIQGMEAHWGHINESKVSDAFINSHSSVMPLTVLMPPLALLPEVGLDPACEVPCSLDLTPKEPYSP